MQELGAGDQFLQLVMVSESATLQGLRSPEHSSSSSSLAASFILGATLLFSFLRSSFGARLLQKAVKARFWLSPSLIRSRAFSSRLRCSLHVSLWLQLGAFRLRSWKYSWHHLHSSHDPSPAFRALSSVMVEIFFCSIPQQNYRFGFSFFFKRMTIENSFGRSSSFIGKNYTI